MPFSRRGNNQIQAFFRRLFSGGSPMFSQQPVVLLVLREEAPVERFVLLILFSQRQRGESLR
jgi:hypothetical protein